MSVLLVLFVLVLPIYGQSTGDIRLVGGSYQWEGRVEIYYSGTWGRVTDSDWTNTEAQVVCRKLGHFKPGAIAFSNAYFGEGSGSHHLVSVNCSGSEYSLTECETKHSGTSNRHSLPVGVKCQPADEAYREGDICLVGGAYDWEGRVEIYWMGQWGTISDSSWTTEDSIVVCRQLRHATGSGVPIPCCDEYGEGVGDIHIHGVACDGTEKNITTCALNFNDTAGTSHQQDVRVQCQQGNEVKEGDIRLIGTTNFVNQYVYGRVEIFLSGIWGTVSDRGAYASIICRQLGYNTYLLSHRCCSRYGQGTGPVFQFSHGRCKAYEHRLIDCPYYTDTVGGHHNDFSVHCYIGGYELGDVGLYYTVHSEYYVQIFLSGRWIPVANSNMTWTSGNSEVVCRELGYAPNGITWYPTEPIRTASEQVDNVVCTGTEPQLTDCSFNITYVESNTAVSLSCKDNDCFDGDVRLAGGETEAEGRLEICSNRKWGTVCVNQWTVNHTAVVCRHLGFSDTFSDSIYFTSERFGRGTGPVFIDYVHCTGSEPRIWGHCIHFAHYYGCTHEDDVGVSCQPASCSDGQLRLIGANRNQFKRVEICSHRRWETLNYYQWTRSAARVACNELGFRYSGSGYDWRLQYGRGGGPIHQKYYQCTGTESRLSECSSYNDTAVRAHNDDVGIRCNTASCNDWELRLFEGNTEFEGRLEVCFDRRWGTIGNEGWSQANSQVFCNSYGYDATEESEVRSIPQSLSKPVHIHNVVCQPTALTLDKCSHERYSGNGNDVTDVIIICQNVSCSDGDLKLVGGSVVSTGRLQICFNKRWSTINADRWTEQYTEVACQQLGYLTEGSGYFTRGRQSPSDNIPVVITDVTCYGTEQRLLDCEYHDYTGILSASHDVYISCSRDHIPAPTNATTFITTGTAIPVSTDYEGDNNGSQTINIVIACSVTVVLCFSMFFGLITGYLCIIQKKKDREKVNLGNRTQAGGEGENVTTVYSDNVSYIPSTGLTKSANSTDDKSVPSARDDSTLTGGEGQNVTTVYTYSDNVSYIPSTGLTKSSKGANSTDDKSVPSVRDDSTLPHQQQLPPKPLETVTQSRVMVDPIYDTCQ